MRRKLRSFADEIGENVYDVADNKISLGRVLSDLLEYFWLSDDAFHDSTRETNTLWIGTIQ